MPRSISAEARAVASFTLDRRQFGMALGCLCLPRMRAAPTAAAQVWAIHGDQPCLLPLGAGQRHVPPAGWLGLALADPQALC